MHSLTTTHSSSSAVQVTLDWSNLFTLYPSRDTHTQIPFLLQWISAYPDRRNVRVYLGAAVRHHEHRRLKNSLQSLGCTVTAKSSAYESPMRFADDTILIDRSNLLV
ncbi:hypothetical protein HY213_04530, partial [Candidatus Peregrinibacteria bacterium]|nr:hypothetical protein [Candidatus Peregrinibacteria bacterium]